MGSLQERSWQKKLLSGIFASMFHQLLKRFFFLDQTFPFLFFPDSSWQFFFLTKVLLGNWFQPPQCFFRIKQWVLIKLCFRAFFFSFCLILRFFHLRQHLYCRSCNCVWKVILSFELNQRPCLWLISTLTKIRFGKCDVHVWSFSWELSNFWSFFKILNKNWTNEEIGSSKKLISQKVKNAFWSRFDRHWCLSRGPEVSWDHLMSTNHLALKKKNLRKKLIILLPKDTRLMATFRTRVSAFFLMAGKNRNETFMLADGVRRLNSAVHGRKSAVHSRK